MLKVRIFHAMERAEVKNGEWRHSLERNSSWTEMWSSQYKKALETNFLKATTE